MRRSSQRRPSSTFAICSTQSEYDSSAKFFVRFSPGKEEIVELEECYDWASVLRTFDNYLDILQRELSVVDPWENAKKYADKLHAVPQTSVHNLPLSGKEKDDI